MKSCFLRLVASLLLLFLTAGAVVQERTVASWFFLRGSVYATFPRKIGNC